MKFFRNNKALILSILAISLPAIIEMSLNTLVGIADTIMISQFIGKEALSAAGFANQIIFTIIFIFSSFNTGATVMISRNHGEKDYVRLNRVLGQNTLLNALIGIFITFLCIVFSKNLLGIFDTSPEVSSMGISYLRIVSYSELFMFISFAAAASLRGVEDTKTPMIITGIVNILNIIGNYFLITGFWIFPKLGVNGAALSTTISRAVGAILFIIVLLKGNRHLKLALSNLRLSKDVLNPLWRFSSNAGIEQFLMQTSFFVMSIIISKLDTTSEAAFRILLTIESTSFMPAIGFSIASATLVGKALGEKNPEKALHTGYISLSLGVLWGMIIGSTFLLFPTQIIGIFSTESDIINKSVIPLFYAGIDQPFLAFIIILSGSLRGAGDTKIVMFITASRLWLAFIPLIYLFVIYLDMGVKSIYIAELISLVVFNFIMFRRLHGKRWMEIQV